MPTIRRVLLAAAILAACALPPIASARGAVVCCLLPDNGGGSASLPPDCSVGYSGPSGITDGLPVGSSLQIAARLHSFAGVVESPGGSLGGDQSSWSALLDLSLTGTGVYLGYNRIIVVPVTGITHSAPRVPFAPVQTFAMNMFQMQGQVLGDPDFDLLRITAGDNFGLPSPGQTTLTWDGVGWEVGSYIDLTHRVDFVGALVGVFAGRSGSTTHVLSRFEMCSQEPTPAAPRSWGLLKATYR